VVKKLVLGFGVLVASCIGCALPKQVKPPTVTDVRHATVFIEATLEDEGWTGTGWYVYSNGKQSLVVTAGHVCAAGATMTVEDYDGVVKGATIVVDSPDGSDDDTCVLSVNEGAPYVLRLGTSDDLDYGDRLYYVGFPAAQIAIVSGAYAGRDARPRLICSVWGYFGASGSAVLGPDGTVVGVLVALNPRFPQTTYSVPVETVRGYVAEALLALVK
jgi:S1-C subfamily serine protease